MKYELIEFGDGCAPAIITRDILKTKQKSIVQSGFEIPQSKLNPLLFPFQKFIVRRALKAGKYAVFADCGLGKTFMQLEWAYRVTVKTNKPVLILALLLMMAPKINCSEGIEPLPSRKYWA